MFPAHFRHSRPDRHGFIVPPVKGRWEDFGMLEVRLAVSRDGVNWSRPSPRALHRAGPRRRVGPVVHGRGAGLVRAAIISTGTTTRPAISTTRRSPARVRRGPRANGRRGRRAAAAGRVRLGRRRPQGGWLGPRPSCSGANVAAEHRHRGVRHRARRVQDADGSRSPASRSRTARRSAATSSTRPCTGREPDVSALAGRPVRLHVQLRRAKLYAFQFAEE